MEESEKIFLQKLDENPAAKSVWEKLPPSHKKEYLKYLSEAKKPETLERRIQKTLQRLENT